MLTLLRQSLLLFNRIRDSTSVALKSVEITKKVDQHYQRTMTEIALTEGQHLPSFAETTHYFSMNL